MLNLAPLSLSDTPIWLLVLLLLLEIGWLWSIIRVATRKTRDPFDRIVWLLIVLALNFLGTILYFLWGGEAAPATTPEEKLSYDESVKRRANSGTLL